MSPFRLTDVPGAGIADGSDLNSYTGEEGTWNDYALGDETAGNGTWTGCTISSNIITDATQVMNDTGGIYLCGCNWNFDTNSGTVLYMNHITNIQPESPQLQPVPAGHESRKGIYVDSGADGVTVEDNHLLNVQNGLYIFFHDVPPNFAGDGQFQWQGAPDGLTPLQKAGSQATEVDEASYGNTPDNSNYAK